MLLCSATWWAWAGSASNLGTVTLERDRLPAQASDGVGKFVGGMIVIETSRDTVPIDRVGMTMAIIQVAVPKHAPVFPLPSIDTEAVQGIADQRGVLTSLITARCGTAAGRVVVIASRWLWMALAGILDLMRWSIATLLVDGVEEDNAIQHHPYGTLR